MMVETVVDFTPSDTVSFPLIPDYSRIGFKSCVLCSK